jgi:hypothetical protein
VQASSRERRRIIFANQNRLTNRSDSYVESGDGKSIAQITSKLDSERDRLMAAGTGKGCREILFNGMIE